MAELKLITAGDGAQCVMITGISMMLTWCVVSLVSPTRPPTLAVRHMARDLVLSGCGKPTVVEERLHCLTVLLDPVIQVVVVVVRMQVLFVTLSLQ